jgi:putative YhbY family RNA-binding protein
MTPLTSAERRALRAKAHAQNPVVSIGQHGLTPGVLHEIDVALLAHELIKIRVGNDDRAARELLYARICAELDAAPVQHIGKLVIIWRPAPEPEPVTARPAARTAVKWTKSGARTARGKPKPGAGAGAAQGGHRAPTSGSAAEAARRRRGAPGYQGNPGAPVERRRRRAT